MSISENKCSKSIRNAALILMVGSSLCTSAQTIEKIKYGDMNSWVKRTVHESSLLGGKKRTIYEVGPNTTVEGENKPYVNMGGSPWGTSNVYAKVSGIVKGSNAIEPFSRGGNNNCAKLMSKMEKVKVLGMINMNVMVAGAMFLGQMNEPVTGTSNPYGKMNMGMPYTKRPSAVVFDYKVEMPEGDVRTKATGFGSKKTLKGHDEAVMFMYLQKRWEDADGNIHAVRVGTAGEKYGKSTNWVNGHKVPVVYGDISNRSDLKWAGLRSKDESYYAKNSKGKLVPVIEEGYDANATPTHVVLMLSAGSGEPYVGTEGLNFYVDNVGFQL